MSNEIEQKEYELKLKKFKQMRLRFLLYLIFGFCCLLVLAFTQDNMFIRFLVCFAVIFLYWVVVLRKCPHCSKLISMGLMTGDCPHCGFPKKIR
jgi:uncharacterized membrane protein